jgi:hypothetical protein
MSALRSFPQLALLIILITAFFYSIFNIVSAQQETRTLMGNCGNPDGLVVQETGRVIAEDQVFEMIGEESVDEDGVSTIHVFDGTIRRQDLFICEVVR